MLIISSLLPSVSPDIFPSQVRKAPRLVTGPDLPLMPTGATPYDVHPPPVLTAPTSPPSAGLRLDTHHPGDLVVAMVPLTSPTASSLRRVLLCNLRAQVF